MTASTKKKAKKASDEVTLRLEKGNSCGYLASWNSCGTPDDSKQAEKFCLMFEGGDESVLTATDKSTKISYAGGQEGMTSCADYMIGIRRGDEIFLQPAKVYVMRPQIRDTNESDSIPKAEQSKKEQMDELNDKFGSQRSKRLMENKRKFAVELDDQDLEDLKEDGEIAAAASQAAPSPGGSQSGQSSSGLSGLSEALLVVPKPNLSAGSIEDIYDLDDIISDQDYQLIKSSHSLEDEVTSDAEIDLKSDLLKGLHAKKKDTNTTIIALCLDAMIQLYKLKPQSLRKDDPLPGVASESVKAMVLGKYCIWLNSMKGRKQQRQMTEQHKDMLLSHMLILLMILTKYQAIEMETLATTFCCQSKQLKKVGTAVGAYFESRKNGMSINKVHFVMRLPLNEIRVTKRKGGMRR